MANEILPFGLGAESNVMTQAEYEALGARSGGFSSGVAKSEQLNKVWRQSSFVASVLADFIAAQSGNDVLDNGNTATLLASLELAIKKYANSNLPIASTLQQGITKLSSSTNSSSETLAATPKAVKTVSDEGLKITGNLAEIKAAGPAAIAEAQSNLDLAALLGDALQKANNLSEIKDAGPAAVAQALANLGGLKTTNNLSEIAAAGSAAQAAARTSIGLGTAAVANVGTGANQVPSMASFGSGDNWCILPNGKIMQWGSYTGSSSSGTISFPVPFIVNPSTVVIGLRGTATDSSAAYVIQDDNMLSKTSFAFRRVGSQFRFNWFCIEA
ncbi:tail fiber repeat 2-containing protein [Yersinia intermedia]|uniref:tail fiber protein n=1 Tax=Yersinia intermedia TaxID=631 RepID=UPI0005EA206F|nr:tail fiber protein [Yersinia intermedia]CNH59528.1 tail fiber repeat 2-containing protein [Yersinia intermedia]